MPRRRPRVLATASGHAKDLWLAAAGGLMRRHEAEILAANARDVEAAPGFGLNAAAIDRLRSTRSGWRASARALHEVAALPDPIGEVIESSRRPNGLDVSRVRVPLGVIFMIYESRPNVTVDAAALCVKSGNAAILRGGKEAIHTNRALHRVLADALAACRPARATPCSSSRRPTAPPSATCCGCPTASTWPSLGAARG